jgi:membrane dipeptidase
MRVDEKQLAASLDISLAAAALYANSDVIDLHVDTFIWNRVFGYDLLKKHGAGPFGARFWGHADVPRMLAAGVTGAHWVITTNPLRTRAGKRDVFFRNLANLGNELRKSEQIELVWTAAGYRAARMAGKHGAFLAVQGGNALEYDLADFDRIPENCLLRITLLHFTRSRIGAPALPRMLRRGSQHLTNFGRDYVRRLNEKRIFVDLAHLARESFFDVLEVHDRTQPLLVTHAGCDAVFPHFRNVTDEQIRAVAETGGVVGVMLQRSFLGKSGVTADTVAAHLAHIVNLVGEDHAAIGTDFDGAITTPRDVKTVSELPRLTDALLRRGVSERAVHKLLGANFLRALAQLRA